MNTNNGPAYPSYGRDPLLDCMPPLRKAGIHLLGYVYTGSGARSSAAVLQDVKRWKAAYPGLEGIFVDEAVGWVRTAGPWRSDHMPISRFSSSGGTSRSQTYRGHVTLVYGASLSL